MKKAGNAKSAIGTPAGKPGKNIGKTPERAERKARERGQTKQQKNTPP